MLHIQWIMDINGYYPLGYDIHEVIIQNHTSHSQTPELMSKNLSTNYTSEPSPLTNKIIGFRFQTFQMSDPHIPYHITNIETSLSISITAWKEDIGLGRAITPTELSGWQEAN